jgi:hypothetical protein
MNLFIIQFASYYYYFFLSFVQKFCSAPSFWTPSTYAFPFFSIKDRVSYVYKIMQLFPWDWILLEKPPVAQPLKNFPIFYGTPKLISVLTSSTTGPYTKPDESTPYYLTLCLWDPF